MRTKNLFTFLAAGALVLSVTTKSNARGGENARYSLGAELALPSGDFGNQSGTGFGGSFRYEKPLNDKIAYMGTVGYLTFGSKTVDDGLGGSLKYSNSMIPILIGGKYYFTDQQDGLYGMLQLGITLLSTKSDLETSSVSSSDSQTNNGLTYSIGAGYHLDNLDFTVGYYGFSVSAGQTNNIGSYSSVSDESIKGNWLGFRVAYVFGEK